MLTASGRMIIYARFWRRVGAGILDGILLTALSMLILIAGYGPAYVEWLRGPTTDGMYGWLDPVVNQLLPIVLPALFWVWIGATPGKTLLDCRVVDAVTLEKISFARALLRSVAYIASFIPLGLGFLWIIWDKRAQGFHDKIAGTVVITETDMWAELQDEWINAGMPS